MAHAAIQPAIDRARPVAAGPSRSAQAAVSGVPPLDRWCITAFLVAIAIPPEAQFNLGPLVLSAQRLLLIVGMLPAALRVVADPRLGVRVADLIALLHTGWAWVALVHAHGLTSVSIEAGGSYTVEFLGSYLVGRALIADPAHALYFARRLLQFVLCIAVLALPEMLTGTHFIREAFGAVFGHRSLAGVTPRFGLTRAFASFDHPILWGVFAASSLGMGWYLAPTRSALGLPRLWRAAAIIGAAFTSLSTGPLMACMVQLGVMLWDFATRGIRGRWWILLAGLAAAYIAIDSLSNRDPLTVFISYLTFNAQTGYDRKLIWEFGMEQVHLTPLFGIGMNTWTTAPDWWHNTSIDAFWLVTALRYGLPGVFSLLAVAVIALVNMVRVPYRPLRPLAMGWLVSFVGLSIAAITVHLWGSTFVLFGFLLGMGVSIASWSSTPSLGAPARQTQRSLM